MAAERNAGHDVVAAGLNAMRDWKAVLMLLPFVLALAWALARMLRPEAAFALLAAFALC